MNFPDFVPLSQKEEEKKLKLRYSSGPVSPGAAARRGYPRHGT
jgi:hypothetical protein